jgi:hypothetical protein
LNVFFSSPLPLNTPTPRVCLPSTFVLAFASLTSANSP